MAQDRASLNRIVAGRGVDPRVLEAFMALDRAAFVPTSQRRFAYEDRPVPLPRSQTTSQPSLIAAMVDAAEVGATDKTLEVGAGYGFQTALLATLCTEVVAIELHPELAEAAESNLRAAGFSNFKMVVGDGWAGYPAGSPFDAIVVSAAAPKVPAALMDQTAEGGRIVIPVARSGSDDVVIYRKRDGVVVQDRVLTPARFVPLVGRDR